MATSTYQTTLQGDLSASLEGGMNGGDVFRQGDPSEVAVHGES